jgi:3-methyl-2-oxobutanoate hydroxymethyltransferase
MSYQASVESAIRNAGRFMAEASCDSIKLEGGVEMLPQVAGIVRAGIPVMGHLGLTPQSVSALGGFRVQGKGAAQARKIVDDARALEDAGAFAVLLEMVPDRVCELITGRARTSFVISLGSGPAAHGQLLIYHDMFGLYPRFKPRMAKLYADAGRVICDGLGAYVQEVRDGSFPQPENYFGMADDAYEELRRAIATDA